jgi:hypothetical protein
MSQVSTRGLASNAVDQSKVKLANNNYLLGRNAANNADINLIKVNASDKPELAAGAQVSGTPSSGNDIVNKTYADNVPGTGANTTLSNLGTTSINSDLLPATNGARSFGSSTLAWLTAFIQSIKDASSVIVLDVTNRILKDAAGTSMIDFSTTANGIDMKTHKLINVVDPTSAQHAATKNYVDSVATAQKTWGQEKVTLSSTDITNQYYDLAHPIVSTSETVQFLGLLWRQTDDYTVALTGGAGGVTRISFVAGGSGGDYGTGGGSALVAGDIVYFAYQY